MPPKTNRANKAARTYIKNREDAKINCKNLCSRKQTCGCYSQSVKKLTRCPTITTNFDKKKRFINVFLYNSKVATDDCIIRMTNVKTKGYENRFGGKAEINIFIDETSDIHKLLELISLQVYENIKQINPDVADRFVHPVKKGLLKMKIQNNTVIKDKKGMPITGSEVKKGMFVNVDAVIGAYAFESTQLTGLFFKLLKIDVLTAPSDKRGDGSYEVKKP